MSAWYVVRTHAQSELKAMEHLLRQGFDVYVPKSRRWRLHARRRDLVLRPLFPRYIFVRFDVERVRWRSIFSTVGVAGLLCHGERPTSVPDGIVEEIRAAESSGSFDDTAAVARLKPGDPVRITRGPFADLIGHLQSLVSADRVRVLLDILGRRVPTMVGVGEVQPA